MKNWNTLQEQWYAEDAGMKERVEAGLKELGIQTQLHEARKKAGLTQEELARRMHVKRSYISRLENHPENIKLGTLIRYTQAVGQTLDIAIHA
jgi:HTH-type transcriptional regulator/antitoxin HipB